MRLLLIRHGESVNEAGLGFGMDTEMTARGCDQAYITAEGVKPMLGGFTVGLTSVWRRCLQTCQPLTRSSNLLFKAVRDLSCEEGYAQSPLNGSHSVYPDFDWTDMLSTRRSTLPFAERIKEVLGKVDRDTVIVTHADVIKKVVAIVCNRTDALPDPKHGSVTLIDNKNLIYLGREF